MFPLIIVLPLSHTCQHTVKSHFVLFEISLRHFHVSCLPSIGLRRAFPVMMYYGDVSAWVTRLIFGLSGGDPASCNGKLAQWIGTNSSDRHYKLLNYCPDTSKLGYLIGKMEDNQWALDALGWVFRDSRSGGKQSHDRVNSPTITSCPNLF